MEEFNYRDTSKKTIRSLRVAHDKAMSKCQRIPIHQLPKLVINEEFSANGFDWIVVGKDPKFIYAKPIE